MTEQFDIMGRSFMSINTKTTAGRDYYYWKQTNNPGTATFASPASFQQSFLPADFCYPVTLILLNAHEDKMAAG